MSSSLEIPHLKLLLLVIILLNLQCILNNPKQPLLFQTVILDFGYTNGDHIVGYELKNKLFDICDRHYRRAPLPKVIAVCRQPNSRPTYTEAIHVLARNDGGVVGF